DCEAADRQPSRRLPEFRTLPAPSIESEGRQGGKGEGEEREIAARRAEERGSGNEAMEELEDGTVNTRGQQDRQSCRCGPEVSLGRYSGQRERAKEQDGDDDIARDPPERAAPRGTAAGVGRDKLTSVQSRNPSPGEGVLRRKFVGEPR